MHEVLREKIMAAKTIPGTLGFHDYQTIPGNNKEIKVKKFSLSSTVKVVSVVKNVK